MTFWQRLVWIVTLRWLRRDPRKVAKDRLTAAHKKAEDALKEVHKTMGELETKIGTVEQEIAKAEKPDRAKIHDWQKQKRELARLVNREVILKDRLSALSDTLGNFQLNEDLEPLDEQDLQILRDESNRLKQQIQTTQVDAETAADDAQDLAMTIEAEQHDDELVELHRELQAKHAPKTESVAIEPEGGKIVVLFPTDKAKSEADRVNEARDVAARAEAVARRLEKPVDTGALTAGTGFDVVEEGDDEDDKDEEAEAVLPPKAADKDDPPAAPARVLDFG